MVISQIPLGSKLLLDNNINTKPNGPKGNDQDEYSIAEMATAVLKDMSVHFLPLHTKTWARYGQTWIMTRLGQ